MHDPAQPDDRNRSTSVEQVVLDTASQLLAEGGVRHLTIERVARRTGFAKTTIYRRWRSRDDLALAVVLRMTRTVVSSPEAADGVDSHSALRDLVTGAVDILRSTPMGSIMRGLASELATDPHLSAAFRAQVVALRRQRLADIVAVGIERGELRPDTDADLLHDLLFGPVYYRLLTSEAPLDRGFATAIVDAVMPGLVPRVGQQSP